MIPGVILFALSMVWFGGWLYGAGYFAASFLATGIGAVMLAIVFSAQVRYAKDLNDILKGRNTDGSD